MWKTDYFRRLKISKIAMTEVILKELKHQEKQFINRSKFFRMVKILNIKSSFSHVLR